MLFVAIRITGSGQTNPGRVRSANEDAWGVFPDLQFFIVADGMGGHAGGEVASRLAVEGMEEFLQTSRDPSEITWPADLDPNLPWPVKRLIIAGQTANHKIFDVGRSDEKLKGMGTTMVSVLVEGDTAYVAHVGDSRAYLIRDAKIKQLTEDHSLVNDYVSQGLLKPEEASQHPLHHVITRALGSNEHVEVDVQTLPLRPGDELLLCSDGLSNLLTEEEMRSEITGSPNDLQAACERLVNLANKKGGDDNITVALISSS